MPEICPAGKVECKKFSQWPNGLELCLCQNAETCGKWRHCPYEPVPPDPLKPNVYERCADKILESLGPYATDKLAKIIKEFFPEGHE